MDRRVSLLDKPAPRRLKSKIAEQLEIANDLIRKQAALIATETKPPTTRKQAPERRRDIYRMADLVPLTGLSRHSIIRAIRKGEFPASIRLTSHAVGWRRRDIEDWLKSRS